MPETTDSILSRRSIRTFKEDNIRTEDINTILEAGRWAPSGLNNQPWKFIVIRNRETIEDISACTHYCTVVKGAPLLIAVFLDHDTMYNHTKDVQAIGASIQNMLLCCHDIGLGAVWLGEILNQKDKVNLILSCPESLELMAVIAIGHPAVNSATSSRKEIQDICYDDKFGKEWRL
ncbi:nitroreductase [Methanolobus sp. ZRKC3]|uniref:nitroreductase family protein n=1 Tax=Methanolobus sp. ZRKC3 TaxID=3125786 RepID=UPI003251DFAC